MTDLRILLVEDHEPTRRILAMLLRSRGYLVTVADSAETALGLIKKNPFDLLVSDIGLPGESGTELMARVKAVDPTLPGIAITALGSLEDEARVNDAGFARYLVKPVSIEKIESVIRDAVAVSLPSPIRV